MSNLQTTQLANHQGPDGPTPAPTEGLLTGPGEVRWERTDWGEPVGFFEEASLDIEPRDDTVHGHVLKWNKIHISSFRLGHRASLLLLQGMSLTSILLPNQLVRFPAYSLPVQVAHLVLRVDPWKFWQPAPRLTGLVMASLIDIPAELADDEVLSALARLSRSGLDVLPVLTANDRCNLRMAHAKELP